MNKAVNEFMQAIEKFLDKTSSEFELLNSLALC